METHTRQRVSETEASARHMHSRAREACKAYCLMVVSVCGGVAEVASLIPFLCSEERESSPTSHFHQHIQQQPQAEDGENVPILEYDNSPRGAAGANVVSGFHCVM